MGLHGLLLPWLGLTFIDWAFVAWAYFALPGIWRVGFYYGGESQILMRTQLCGVGLSTRF
uniref:Uncharacterized protein n=1 Tax=Picea glauca TaxID=3330 RepID=A0A124GNM9_PICGL|nr:hypothetical protein ABT39_MTgene3890 [Picea glauca]QHR86709.1 hypothetical protein Q903MT_gene713 [Picea sitchensis]